jgi:hypothetical protein
MKKYVLFSLVLASCAKVDSREVKSGGVYATFAVNGDSAGAAECEAVFQVGDLTGTYMSLEGGDEVTCDGKAMTRSELLGMISYSVRVPYEVGRSYTVELKRPGEEPYRSVVTLPEPVTITWPRAGERVAGARGLELKWELGRTTDYDVRVTVSGPRNTAGFAPEHPDKGSRFVDSSSLPMPEGSSAENFTAVVTRSRAGSFPAGLSGGRSSASRTGRVTFTLTK